MNRWQRIVVMAWLVLCLFVGAGEAFAKPGARDALQVLERARGSELVVNVVGMVGFNGNDQPVVWKLLVRDKANAEILQEFSVTGEAVTSQAEVRRADFADLPDKPVMGTSLRVDSTEAYRIADDEAILAGASFERINYQLRFRGTDPAPTWLLTLVDANGGLVGHVVIDASDGSIPYRNFPGGGFVASAQVAGPAPGRDTTYASGPATRRSRAVGPKTKRGGGFH